jgi:hypothetical protein
VVGALEQRDEGADTALHVGARRLELGSSEQRKQRWLVGDQAAKHLGVPHGRPERNHTAERVAGHMRRSKIEFFNQRGEVVRVLEQRTEDRIPAVMIAHDPCTSTSGSPEPLSW